MEGCLPADVASNILSWGPCSALSEFPVCHHGIPHQTLGAEDAEGGCFAQVTGDMPHKEAEACV